MQKPKRPPSPPSNQAREYSLKCQCTLQRNNLPLKLNSKSKYFSLVLRPPRHLSIHPFSKQEVLIEFDVARIRSIQRRFIQEGKLTIEVYEGSEPLVILATDVSLENNRKELLAHIFIHNSIKQSLEMFIERIAEMQKELKRKSVCNVAANNNHPRSSVVQEKEGKPVKKAVSRRQLMKEAQDQQQKLVYEELRKVKQFQEKRIVQLPKKVSKPSIGLTELPVQIFKLIMNFVGQSQMGLRVLNKKLSEFVLLGLKRVVLQDEVDEATFKKLTKHAFYVECRMKNVREIDHFTNFSEDGPINPNNSRWLNFSKWRQMSAKNIDQLKGLRLYCLEIPYLIKFESSSLIGLKLVCLKLKAIGKGVQQQNPNITDANITMLVNLCTHLTMLEIARVGQQLLDNIKQPQKMLMLRIGTLELSKTPAAGSLPWYDFRRFSCLKQLSINHCVDHLQRPIEELPHTTSMNFPVGLESLAMGTFLNIPTLMNGLPEGLQQLAVAGQHIKNIHISETHLPNIKILDIRECPAVTIEGLLNCRGIQIRLRWEDYSVQAARYFFFERSITVINEKPKR